MTVVVLLILAGVSLNAIIGENGIITNASNAKFESGMAALEEFIQEKYLENYDKFNEKDKKVRTMQLLYPEYFYIPVNEKVGGLTYIVNSQGHVFYLIKKSGLPKEIRELLVGGDAGKGTYSDYASLNDVYGVTGDLKVYYSSSPNSKITGITDEELDIDDTSREVFAAGSSLSDLINGGDKSKNVTAENARGVSSLTIDQNSGVKSFEDFYNLPSLETLRLSNVDIESLSGIENAPNLSVVYLTNVTCGNYSSLGKLENRLTELYIINSKDVEIDKLFGTYDEASGVGTKNGLSNYDLPNLKILEISGFLIEESSREGGLRTEQSASITIKNNDITKISQLKNLSDITKKAIENLLINNNNIKSLTGIEDLTNIKTFRADTNSITNIDSLKKINFEYCFLNNNSIGIDDDDALKSLENLNGSHSKLEYLRINDNKIKKVIYLASYKDSEKIQKIYGKGNDSIIDIPELIVLNGKCFYEFDAKYALSLLDPSTTELNLENQELTFDNLVGIGNCTKMQKLSLKNVKIKNDGVIISSDTSSSGNRKLAEDKVSEMLEKLTQIVQIDLDGCKFITNLDFMEGWNKTALTGIRISNTSIANMSKLNDFMNLTAVMCYGSPCKVNDLEDSVIIRLLSRTGDNWFLWDSIYVCSLDIDNEQSLSAIWPLDGVTTVGLHGPFHTTLLDFSLINSITSVFIGGDVAVSLDPTNLTSIAGWACRLSFSENKQGGSVELNFAQPAQTIVNVLNTFTSVDFIVRNVSFDFSGYDNCDKIVRLSNNQQYSDDYSYSGLNKLTNLQTLELLYGGNITISDVSELTKLTTVKIADPVGSDILTKLPIANLVTLELTNSKVTDISPLITASKLERLSLANGAIFERFSYEDKINVSTLQIFIDLRNQYGKLKRLYLAGCKNIRDWSILENSGIKWDDWSGFSGK